MVRAVVAATTASALLAGCSSSEPAPVASTTRTSVPPDVEVPAGVQLTPAGTSLTVGEPATVVYRVGDSAASAVTVTVTAATAGSIDDFTFFSLDEASRRSKPYYVSVTVRNDGPAGLGGAALPLYAFDSTGTSIPANDILGSFEPCPTPTLPTTFLPGASADLCLVYLVPEGRRLRSVNLQTGTVQDAISWTR